MDLNFHIIDLLLILLGFAAGVIGTLIGAGGGFLLVPVLIFLWPDIDRDIITSVSLAVVFVNALSGSLSYLKMKRVDIKSGIIFAIATIPGAILGAHTTQYLPKARFDQVFGILLIIIASVLIWRAGRLEKPAKEPSPRAVRRRFIDAEGHEHSYAFRMEVGIGTSLIIGYLSSFFGIGGGIIHVPVLVGLMNFPVHVATATSHFTLAISALAGTIEHIIEGTLDKVILKTLFLAFGVYFGAKLGARLSKKVNSTFILRGAAIALFLVGVRMLIGAFHISL